MLRFSKNRLYENSIIDLNILIGDLNFRIEYENTIIDVSWMS
jgi:hypothetical protein